MAEFPSFRRGHCQLFRVDNSPSNTSLNASPHQGVVRPSESPQRRPKSSQDDFGLGDLRLLLVADFSQINPSCICICVYICICSPPPPRSTFQWFSCPEESDRDRKDCCEAGETKHKNSKHKKQHNTEHTKTPKQPTTKHLRPYLEGLWTMVSEIFLFLVFVGLFVFVGVFSVFAFVVFISPHLLSTRLSLLGGVLFF